MIPARSVQADLGDLAEIKTGFPDADFWVWRRGARDKVGHPTRSFNPEHYGIKVRRRDLIDPQYLYYVLEYIASQGRFAQLATGTTGVANIRIGDLASLPFALEIPVGGRGSGASGPRDPYPLVLGVIALSAAALIAYKLVNGD